VKLALHGNTGFIGPLLARGYFLSSSQDPENLIRAETALEEVIATIDTSVDHVSISWQSDIPKRYLPTFL
jgi:hypothetical protein